MDTPKPDDVTPTLVTNLLFQGSDRHVEAIERSTLQAVEAHREYTRSYFTMAAGALALSIPMAQFLDSRGGMLRPLWALVGAWCFLGLTMLITPVRHTLEAQLRLAFGKFHRNRQHAMTQAFDRLNRGEASEEVSRAVWDREKETLTEAERIGRVYDGYCRAVAWSCIIGYGLLILFAIRSLA